MNRIEQIAKGLKACNRKCRKCSWHDLFSGECMLMDCAADYIGVLEEDNAKKIVYCKDCIYCAKKEPTYRFESEAYECKNRDGLPVLPNIKPTDYCSRGVRKTEVKDDENA